MVAGDGLLPVKMAQYAKENGFEVVAISLSNDNYNQLKKYCSKVYSFCPGEVQKIEDTLKSEGIKQVTFLGKVSKTVLLKRPKFDQRALDFIKKAIRLNDDKVMIRGISSFFGKCAGYYPLEKLKIIRVKKGEKLNVILY